MQIKNSTLFFSCRSKKCNHTFMSFIQADPETIVAVLKYFHIAFNELLLIRIFNAGQHSTFTRKTCCNNNSAVYSFLLTL